VKTFRPKKDDLKKDCILVDVSGMILGRICSKIAFILRGKHKPIVTPGVDCGDHVLVINSDKIKVTGNKLEDNIFYKHTTYVGNMKETKLKDRMAKDSTEVIKTAVKRMLPRGPLGRAQLRMLSVYSGEHYKQPSVKIKEYNFKNLGRI
jgi:large subunit ribosomal protein L13